MEHARFSRTVLQLQRTRGPRCRAGCFPFSRDRARRSRRQGVDKVLTRAAATTWYGDGAAGVLARSASLMRLGLRTWDGGHKSWSETAVIVNNALIRPALQRQRANLDSHGHHRCFLNNAVTLYPPLAVCRARTAPGPPRIWLPHRTADGNRGTGCPSGNPSGHPSGRGIP